MKSPGPWKQAVCCALVSLCLGTAALWAQTPSRQDSLARVSQMMAAQQCRESEELLNGIPGSSLETRFRLARCYGKRKDLKKAMEILDSILRRSDSYTPAVLLRARILYNTGKYYQSFLSMQDYTTRDPENGDAWLILGLSQFMLKKNQDAEVSLRRATELSPGSGEAFYYMGRLAYTENDMPSALRAFQRAVEIEPTSMRAHNNLALTHEALAQFDLARAAYLKAIELEQKQAVKSEWPYFNLGALRFKEGHPQEAIDYVKEALLRKPGWAKAKVKLAIALAAVGNLAGARAQLEAVLRSDARNADAHYQLALVLVRVGEKELADQHFTRFNKFRQSSSRR